MRNKLRSSRLAILVAVFLVCAIVVSSALSIWVARRQSIEEWRGQLSNLSLILAEQTTQEITAAYLVLDSIAATAAGIASAADLRTRMASADIYQNMRDKKGAAPQIDVATIVAANGDVINFTRSHPAPPINLADRDYFLAHVNNPDLGVFISTPVRNKGNGQWTFYLSRRLNGAHGQFIGLVLVGVSSTFLSDFYRKISLGAGASVTLYRRDFAVLARWPLLDEVMGKVNRSGSSYIVIEEMKKTADVLLTSVPRFSQQGRETYRLGAPRLLEKYPLIINITVTEDLFLRQWYKYAWLIVLVAGSSITAIAVAFLWLLKALKRREYDMETTERLKTEAEAASHAKSEFLAMMSHEIRTPLTSIIGFAELIDNESGRIILRNGQHLLSIINDILDISKIEAGRLLLEQMAFSPLEVVAGVESMMRAQAYSKGVAFVLEVAYPIPAQVLADPTRWKQILFNLCGNAIKFTELGEVRLRLSYDDGQLLCAVSDTGIGMSAQQMTLLFQPFSQADSAITRKYGGTGLGLHLVRELAGKMGGAVGVSSELGRGSCFEVRVAARAVDACAWLTEAPHAVAPAPGEPAARRLHGRVLLAEDGPDNRKLIGAFLARLGLQFVVVENGAQAVEHALRDSFDVILMDVQMPVLDGVAATRTLRAAGFEAPIVALTANVMAEDVERYRLAGCTRCVGKPIDFTLLAHCLSELLAQGSQGLQEAAPLDQLDGYDAIRRSFEDALPPRLSRLQGLVDGADWNAVGELAHLLKGSAASFGYPRVTELARALEPAAHLRDGAAARAVMLQLLALSEVRALLREAPT
ncbi:signal transduction histidine kinase/CheY-like chemotaxis protein [Oxalobacteraceae bacterium GrIS 1.11]